MLEDKIKVYDLNACHISERNGMYGGMAGLKEGIVWRHEFWLIKYPKTTKEMDLKGLSYTTSPLSEFIGSQIYKILGYNVHETVLGERNGKIVVACKDFCKKVGDLREIRTLKNIYNEVLAERLELELDETSSSHSVDLKELLIHFEHNPVLSNVKGLKERFWDCAIIDGIIKNNNRNNGNWGLLNEDNVYKIAPIFDNGASFSNKISDEKIAFILEDEGRMRNNSLNSITTYALHGKQLNLNALLDLDLPELKEAICRVTPLLKRKMQEIEDMIHNIPNEYRHLTVCSNDRKAFYIKGMKLRIEELLVPAFDNIVEERSVKKLLKEI